MANQVTYSVLVDVDSTQVDALLQKLDQVGQKATQTFQTMATSAGSATSANQQLAQAVTQASQAVNQLNSAAQASSSSVNNITVAHGKAASAVKGHAGATRELMVLLHEASQGNFKRFGGSLLVLGEQFDILSKLMSPMGLAIGGVAAVVGVLALAFVKGAEETATMNKALIMTNDYSGLTASSLRGLATQAAATGGNIGTAKEAFNALAATGKFTGDQVAYIGEAAIKMHQTIGAPIEDTIKQFEELAKSPVDASKKLNDQYHYLTEAVYEQIKALQEQGREQEAANLAEETYAKALDDRTKQIQQNQGYIVKGWDGVKNAASAAWDAMLGIGREQTLDEKIAGLKAKIANSGQAGANADDLAAGGSMFTHSTATDADKQQLAQLESLKRNQETNAALKATADQTQQAGIAADDTLGKFTRFLKGTSADADLATQKIKELHKAIQDGLAADPTSKKWLSAQASEGTADANIRKFYAGSQGKRDAQNALGGKLQDEQNDINASNEMLKAQEAKVQADRDANLITEAQYLQRRHDLRMKALENDKMIADQQVALAQGLDSKTKQSKYKGNAQLFDLKQDTENETFHADMAKATTKEATAYDTARAALEKYQAQQRLSESKSLNKITMSDKDAAFADVQDKIHTEYASKIDDYTRGAKNQGVDPQTIEQNIQLFKEQEQAQVQDAKDSAAQTISAQQDWVNGAKVAFENYVDNAANASGNAKQAFTSMFDQMNTALTNFVTTGKLNFASLTSAILQDLAKMAMQAAESKIFGMIMDSFGGNTGFSSFNMGSGASAGGMGFTGIGSESASASSAVSTSFSGSALGYAKGGTFINGVQMFADGGAFSNGIYNSPTAFAMAGSGMGVLGEAGPEAVVPLTRGKNGKLGIAASGGGAAQSSSTGGDTYNITVNVTGGSTNDQTGSVVSQAVYNQMQAIAKNEIVKANRSGGVNNSVQLGTAK